MLRNHADFRIGFEKEIGTYQKAQKNFQNENGILTFLNEATGGEMRELVRDIGINNESMEFISVGDLLKKKE